jgi:hypothetical protein
MMKAGTFAVLFSVCRGMVEELLTWISQGNKNKGERKEFET